MREGFRLTVWANGLWQTSVQSIAGRLPIVCNMKAVLVFISQLSQQKSYGCWCLQSSPRASETAVHYLNGLTVLILFVFSWDLWM